MDLPENYTDYNSRELKDLEIKYFPNFLSPPEADLYFTILIKALDWKQYKVKIFGKEIPQPRLSALYAESEVSYTYSGLTLTPNKFSEELLEIRRRLKNIYPIDFTHCLANLYRDGSDSMGLHSDDENELGKDPVIASISLGATRKFKLKHKFEKGLKFDLDLEPGSLLLMAGGTQHYWKHELPKTAKPVGPRINLTYRKLLF
ncbi:alpha-ketoglutarate-dependent dioxygenase AlkB [soil metagenome]